MRNGLKLKPTTFFQTTLKITLFPVNIRSIGTVHLENRNSNEVEENH